MVRCAGILQVSLIFLKGKKKSIQISGKAVNTHSPDSAECTAARQSHPVPQRRPRPNSANRRGDATAAEPRAAGVARSRPEPRRRSRLGILTSGSFSQLEARSPLPLPIGGGSSARGRKLSSPGSPSLPAAVKAGWRLRLSGGERIREEGRPEATAGPHPYFRVSPGAGSREAGGGRGWRLAER